MRVQTSGGEVAAVLMAVRRIGWRVLLPLAVGYILLLLDRSAASYVAPQIGQALSLDAFHVGLTTPILFLGILLFEVPSAMVAGRVGAGRWLALLALVWGCATAATAAVGSPAWFYVARSVASVAQAGYLPVAVFMVARALPVGWRTRMLSWVVLAALVAGVLEPNVIGLVLRLHGTFGMPGWRWVFLCLGLPCLPLAVLLARLPAEIQAAAWLAPAERDALAWMRSLEARTRRRQTGLDALLDPRILLLAGLNFGLSLSTFAAGDWYAALMHDTRAPLFAMSAVFVVAIVATVLLWSRQADRTGRVGDGLLIACALATVGYAAAVVPGPVVTKLVGLVAHGATLAAARTLMWSIGSRAALLGGGAAALAIIDATGLVATFIAPRVVLGVVQQTQNLQLGLMILTVSLAAATLLAALLKFLTRDD